MKGARSRRDRVFAAYPVTHAQSIDQRSEPLPKMQLDHALQTQDLRLGSYPLQEQAQNETTTLALQGILCTAFIANFEAMMRGLGLLFLAATSALATPRGPPGWGPWGPGNRGCKKIQHDFGRRPHRPDPRAERIKQAYLDSWNEYAEYAFGHNELLPLTHEPNEPYINWGLTIVDGLDTAAIMGLTDVVDRQLAFIETIDFTKSDTLQNVFDSTIRWIGGLLSAYDLITNNKVPNARHYNRTQVNALLKGAQTLADFFEPVFDTPTGLPHFFRNSSSGEVSDGPYPYTDPFTNITYTEVINTAIAGTSILEWHRLSDLTGNDKYRRISDRSNSNLVHPQPKPIYPNLVGSMLDINTGKFFAFDAGWQSGIDSFYEYLIKSAIYNPKAGTAQEYKDYWITTVESTQRHLVEHPYDHPELTFITQLNESGVSRHFQDDYACFAGGNLLLGGAYLDRQDFINLGLAHADSCHRTFNATVSGLNPLQFAWYGPKNSTGAQASTLQNNAQQIGLATQLGPKVLSQLQSRHQFPINAAQAPADQGGFYDENGFYIVNGLYTLYPEPIESMFYAWRVTGDTKWQDYVWSVFEALQRDGNRGGTSMSSLYDVEQPLGGGQFNNLPSYYFAETLKYLYLTFSDTDLVVLDEFVFNTEGHPLRVQFGTCNSQHGWW